MSEESLMYLTILLGWNLHTIKSTHFKCTVQWVWVNLSSYANITIIHNLVLGHFHYPNKISHGHLWKISSLTSSPRKPLAHFLKYICLYWTCHINGIVHYVIFYVWLLLLIIMFLRFVHLAAVSVFFSFCWWVVSHCINIPYFVTHLPANRHKGYFQYGSHG